MLHQGESQSCAAKRTALAYVNTIEALRYPRQVLGSDAGTIISYRYSRLRRTGCIVDCKRNLDALAGRSIFERILNQIFKHTQKLIAVAAHAQRLGRRKQLDVHAPVAG